MTRPGFVQLECAYCGKLFERSVEKVQHNARVAKSQRPWAECKSYCSTRCGTKKRTGWAGGDLVVKAYDPTSHKIDLSKLKGGEA